MSSAESSCKPGPTISTNCADRQRNCKEDKYIPKHTTEEIKDYSVEAQVQALERKKQDDAACGEIESHHPGYLGSQDTFYVSTIKGVGSIYQQTFVDTYSKWATAKLYTTKTLITGADLLNDRVLPFFTSLEMGIVRMLTDRGTEYWERLKNTMMNSILV